MEWSKIFNYKCTFYYFIIYAQPNPGSQLNPDINLNSNQPNPPGQLSPCIELILDTQHNTDPLLIPGAQLNSYPHPNSNTHPNRDTSPKSDALQNISDKDICFVVTKPVGFHFFNYIVFKLHYYKCFIGLERGYQLVICITFLVHVFFIN